jgi:2TM domain
MQHEPEVFEEARRHVRRKRIFYIVLGVWVALCVMWFVIDMTDDSSSIWFYWPMFGSGIAVAITGIVLLGIGGCSASNGSAEKSTSIYADKETSQAREDGMKLAELWAARSPVTGCAAILTAWSEPTVGGQRLGQAGPTSSRWMASRSVF